MPLKLTYVFSESIAEDPFESLESFDDPFVSVRSILEVRADNYEHRPNDGRYWILLALSSRDREGDVISEIYEARSSDRERVLATTHGYLEYLRQNSSESSVVECARWDRRLPTEMIVSRLGLPDDGF